MRVILAGPQQWEAIAFEAMLRAALPQWPERGSPKSIDVRYFFDVARAEAWAEHRARHAPWCSSCGEEWGW